MSTSPSKKRVASSPGGAERRQKSRQRSVSSPTSGDGTSAAAAVGAVAPSVEQPDGVPDTPPESVSDDSSDDSPDEPSEVPRRPSWEDHRDYQLRQKMFKPMYRMDEDSFDDLVNLIRPALMSHEHYYRTGTPSKRGPPVPVEIRLAVGLRMVYGATHYEVCDRFGLPLSYAEPMVGQVADAINNCEQVGKKFLPRTKKLCRRFADRFEVQEPRPQDVYQQEEMAMSREY